MPAAGISEIIDERPLSRFQISTITLCGLILLLDGFDTQCIGFLAPGISESLSIPLKAFGPVFSAALIGLMIAAMVMGPVADRWGRKWPVVLSAATFAIFALLTARAASLEQLIVLRFLTGLGLGGAMPNVVALTSEYSPKRLQAVFVGMLFVGMPLGALVGGLVSSVMIPLWGWRSVFYLGGVAPLAIAVILIKALPESVRFLTARGKNTAAISAIMRKIAPDISVAGLNSSFAAAGVAETADTPVRRLFTDGRATGTVLLWIPFFMNLLMLYFIVNWLPGLLRQSGLAVSAGVIAVSIFSLGGIVGCIAEGRIMNSCGPYPTLLVEFVFSALLVGAMAFLTRSFATMMAVTFVLGVAIQGAQAGLNALAANFYPTTVRSTGVGWALGVGRVGSIVGPAIGGILLSIGWTPQRIFLAGMAPALLASLAILWSGRIRGQAGAFQTELERGRA
ncbi:MAG TPA: MFS transporter [Candidatus Acidoferrales bacterium]|nr:MFS transporter [Candidatus Acidoferrales bacterium]